MITFQELIIAIKLCTCVTINNTLEYSFLWKRKGRKMRNRELERILQLLMLKKKISIIWGQRA